PDVGVSRPATRRSVVDLPQPDGPSSTTSVPTAASKLTSSTARVAPQDLVTRWREIAGIASARAGGRSAASRAKSSIARAAVKAVALVLCSGRGGSPMPDWTPPVLARVEGYFKELNNWGRWGDGDQTGTVNLVTAAKRARAQVLVKTGRTVSLARDIGPQPALMYHPTFPSNRERAD